MYAEIVTQWLSGCGAHVARYAPLLPGVYSHLVSTFGSWRWSNIKHTVSQLLIFYCDKDNKSECAPGSSGVYRAACAPQPGYQALYIKPI